MDRCISPALRGLQRQRVVHEFFCEFRRRCRGHHWETEKGSNAKYKDQNLLLGAQKMPWDPVNIALVVLPTVEGGACSCRLGSAEAFTRAFGYVVGASLVYDVEPVEG